MILKSVCSDCLGEGNVECENCEGTGDCYCSRCDKDHECGWCEGEGQSTCETCKGEGTVEWSGQGQPPPDLEEAVCDCGRPAQAVIGKEEVCPICEATWVLRELNRKYAMAESI